MVAVLESGEMARVGNEQDKQGRFGPRSSPVSIKRRHGQQAVSNQAQRKRRIAGNEGHAAVLTVGRAVNVLSRPPAID